VKYAVQAVSSDIIVVRNWYSMQIHDRVSMKSWQCRHLTFSSSFSPFSSPYPLPRHFLQFFVRSLLWRHCIILVSVSVSLKACQSVTMSNQQFELKVGAVYKNNPFHNIVVPRVVAGSLIYYTLAATSARSLFGTYEIFWVWEYSSLNPIILFYV